MESRFRNLEIIDDQVAEILRTKTVAERFAMIDQFAYRSAIMQCPRSSRRPVN